MKVLVIDIGGNNVKMLASGHKQPVKFPSGRSLTPEKMVAGVKKVAANWQYDVVSIGVPGPLLLGQPILDPQNLGPGWVAFDFSAAFGAPVKLVNDAAMQALGSYRGRKCSSLGLVQASEPRPGCSPVPVFKAAGVPGPHQLLLPIVLRNLYIPIEPV